MAYNAVHTWSAYEVATAANLNNNDANLDYLKTSADTFSPVQNIISPSGSLATGDGKGYFYCPPRLDGTVLTDYDVGVHTPSTSGAITIMLHNLTAGVDMLSTAATIDQDEYTSMTAATAPVIDTNNDDIDEGDILRVDIDGAGTGAAGLWHFMDFYLN